MEATVNTQIVTENRCIIDHIALSEFWLASTHTSVTYVIYKHILVRNKT